MTKEQQIATLSDILNKSRVFDSYAIRTGIKLDNDSDIWHEIEEFIVDKINEDTNYKKYQVKDLIKGDIFATETHTKTEQELREWAEEIRQNEGLQDVVPNYTEIDNLNGKYFDDLDNCIEFLEEYDWEITEITN